jgi:Glycosyl hydrolases family 31
MKNTSPAAAQRLPRLSLRRCAAAGEIFFLTLRSSRTYPAQTQSPPPYKNPNLPIEDSSARGFPMVRPLFFEYPNDPGSWTIEDEYMFGSDLLVAPMFANGERRKVYLPPGSWIDYQSGRVYEGANVELRVFSTDSAPVSGLFTRPGAGVQTLSLVPRGRDFVLREDPQHGKVKWTISSYPR